MRLNFTASTFAFGHINHENVPRTFSLNLASGELPNLSELRSKQLGF